EVADLARRQLRAVLTDHAELVAREWLPHRARTDRQPRDVRREDDRLGLPVAVVNEEPESVVPFLDDLGIQRLAPARAVAEAWQPAAAQVLLPEQPVLGRRGAEDRDLVALEEVELALRVEPSVEHEDGDTVHPRTEEDPVGGLRPASVGRRPMKVRALEVEPILTRPTVRERVTVAMEHGLRLLGGARGVEAERRLVAARARRDAPGRGTGDEGLEVVPAGRRAADRDPDVEPRDVGERRVDLGRLLDRRHDRPRAAVTRAVGDVL